MGLECGGSNTKQTNVRSHEEEIVLFLLEKSEYLNTFKFIWIANVS